MASASLSLRTGFDRKPSMPEDRHSSRSLSLALAVMATIGTLTPALLTACNQDNMLSQIVHKTDFLKAEATRVLKARG